MRKRFLAVASLAGILTALSPMPADAQPKGVVFAITGRIADAVPEGTRVDLLMARCAAKCAPLWEETVDESEFVLWGDAPIPQGAQLRILAVAKTGVYASDPFALQKDETADVVVKPVEAAPKSKSALVAQSFSFGRPFGWQSAPLRYVHRTIYFVTDRAVAANGAFNNDARLDDSVASGSVIVHLSRCYQDSVCKGQTLCSPSPLSDWACDTDAPHDSGDSYLETPANYGDPFASPAVKPTIAQELDDIKVPDPTVKTLLVFVHGFNVDFLSSIDNGAKLSLEAEHRSNVPLVYSWPSLHDIQAYASDQERSAHTIDHFVSFLKMLETLTTYSDPGNPVRRIILVAHSMGVHVVTEGLARWVQRNGGTPPFKFEKVIFFAGDEGQTDWNGEIAPGITRSSLVLLSTSHLKVYQNANDMALMASQCVMHDDRRLGQPATNLGLAAPDGQDLTDLAGYSGAGHGYFVMTTGVAMLFSKLLTRVQPATDDVTLPWLGWPKKAPRAPDTGICVQAMKYFL